MTPIQTAIDTLLRVMWSIYSCNDDWYEAIDQLAEKFEEFNMVLEFAVQLFKEPT